MPIRKHSSLFKFDVLVERFDSRGGSSILVSLKLERTS